MSSNNTASQIYSYHTFLLAFHYDGDNKPSENGSWTKYDLLDFSKMNDDTEKKLNYQRIQYFTPEARELFFQNGKYYKYDLSPNEQYKIEKKTDNGTLHYDLDVNEVRVILFEGNIGVLILELENTKYTSLQAVKHINEYGRRINLPYIGDGQSPHALVADKITFLGKTEDFVQKGKDILSKGNMDQFKDGYIMEPVKNLLDELLPQHGKIIPVLDDRMFVCCMVRDGKLSQDIENGKDFYLDKDFSQKIYALSFIDATDASCQGVEMREEILKRCTDSRWRDWGTIDVITHHSLVRITGGVEKDYIVPSVVNPFLIQYVYLAIGALVQRATILSLSAESAEISEEYSNDGFSGELDKKLRKLKKKYVYAQNNIFLHELTVQEQGVEEFDMLKNELYIKDSLENLNNKIDGLYGFVKEYSDDKEDRKFNVMGVFLALMFIFEPMSIIIANNSNENIIQAWWWAGIPMAFIAIVTLAGFGLYTFKRIWRKCRQKMRKTRR